MSITTPYLWERERSAHLLAHSRPGTSRRRRAELLARQARRGQRAGTGVAGSALHDEVTPPMWRRLTSKDDDQESLARGLFVGLGACAGCVLVGPAVLLGWGAYKALERFAAPRVGRLPAWPGVAVTAALLLVLIPLGVLPVGVGVNVLPHLPIVQVVYSKADWLLWQVVLAPAVTAYLIWAWGWAGVPRGAVKPSERNKDGSFRVTPDEEKVSLAVSEPEAKPEDGDAEQRPVKRVVRRVRLAQPQELEPVDISDMDPDELPDPPQLPDDDFSDYEDYDENERGYL